MKEWPLRVKHQFTAEALSRFRPHKLFFLDRGFEVGISPTSHVYPYLRLALCLGIHACVVLAHLARRTCTEKCNLWSPGIFRFATPSFCRRLWPTVPPIYLYHRRRTLWAFALEDALRQPHLRQSKWPYCLQLGGFAILISSPFVEMLSWWRRWAYRLDAIDVCFRVIFVFQINL